MIAKPRFTLMAVAVLMVLVFSAVFTAPAFADDSTPPPTETPTEATPSTEEETAEVPAVEPEAPAAEPATVAADESAPAVAVDEIVPAEQVVLTEVLEQLPEGTDVQVVDENGEALPLATQEAADAIELGDPIWCPLGVAPKAGIGGCSPSFTSFTDDATPTDAGLIDWLNNANAASVSKAGVIWIAFNYNSALETGPIEIDGLDVAGTMETFALTIKGGWNGTPGSTVVNQSTPSTFNGVSLSIINWLGNVTISDIVITDATSDTDTGNNTYALEVETNKNIQLDRVTVIGSENFAVTGTDAMTGAKLNNSSSTISSTVIVNNSIFDDNEGDGLLIQSAGIVTITSLFANGNDVSGAVIDNTLNPSLTAPDKAVTLKGSLEFHTNGEAGLIVNSKGLITISNVNASENGATGVNLDNTASKTLLGVTIKGTNNFTSNAIGLNVLTHGVITANSISASDNGGTGAILDNCDKTIPTGYCLALIAKTVKLTGNNSFNDNNNNGLEIYSFGSITVASLIALGNSGTGVILDNQTKNNANVQIDSVGTIVQTGYGIFNDNETGDGLRARSHGNITLTALTATNNGDGLADGDQIGYVDFNDNGVEVNADKTNVGAKIYVANVTISGLNYFTGNDLNGLLVNADGKVTVSSITASFNTGNGAELNTTDVGYGVTLTGTNTFIDNGATGLNVDSTGAIAVSNVTSVSNLTGASLYNQFNTAKRYNVTLSGTNSFNNNQTNGLWVDSYGVITANNLTANWNGINLGDYGVTLDNCNLNTGLCIAVTPSAVTLTGYVNTSNNYDRGLDIESLGAVTLSYALANHNGGLGVYIKNQYNPLVNKLIVRGVTLKGTNIFNGNDSTGLAILSYGAITLTNINAHYNGDSTPGETSGVYLNNENTGAIVAKNITITGVNSFIGNYMWGLEFHTKGIATLTRISANGNDWDTANAKIGGGVLGTAKTITLTCGHMFGNGIDDPARGYNLTATGVITIKGIYSAGNGGTDFADGSSEVITKACALP